MISPRVRLANSTTNRKAIKIICLVIHPWPKRVCSSNAVQLEEDHGCQAPVKRSDCASSTLTPASTPSQYSPSSVFAGAPASALIPAELGLHDSQST